jgi:hypothetical protein
LLEVQRMQIEPGQVASGKIGGAIFARGVEDLAPLRGAPAAARF